MSVAAELLEALPERYALGRHLADGGMGSVWCAEDLTLGRTVAIKVLAARFAADPTAMQRFAREARAAARVSTHPHVVTIYDVGEANGRPFIVMELVSGGTVADALLAGEVSREEAVRWIGEAAEALDYAHREGIVHRDVKPQNMLLDRQRSLRLADFGIAHLASEDLLTRTREVMGTAAYLAPEQAMGGRGSAASDRYSLAVVAFELLTGRRPFIAEHPAAQARAHLEDHPPAASQVDSSIAPAVDRVLERGMAKRVDERWPTASSFARALAGAVEHPAQAPTAAQTAPLVPRQRRPAPPPPPRPTRRSPAAAASAALAAAIAILLAIILANGGGASSGSSRTAQRAGPPAHHVAARKPAAPAPAQTATTPSSAAAAAPSTSSASTPTPVPATPDALESEGHDLLGAGNYAQAITVLRQAVASIPHEDLNYAYALFDLGRALRLDGQPQAAIPILEQRLAIPNQTDVVSAELRLARQAAGGEPAPGGHGPDGKGPPGQKKKHDGSGD